MLIGMVKMGAGYPNFKKHIYVHVRMYVRMYHNVAICLHIITCVFAFIIRTVPTTTYTPKPTNTKSK